MNLFPSGVIQATSNNNFIPLTTNHSAGWNYTCLVSAGETYEWSTRAGDGGVATYDSELTLSLGSDTSTACYGNDPDNDGALISWTAPDTGYVLIQVNVFPCSANDSTTTIVWRCATCADLPITLIPVDGMNTVECGTDTRLQDAGGYGPYVNNSHGYTVLEANGGAVIRIRGPYLIESSFDVLHLHAGSGIDGTLLATYSGFGHIDFTGDPGQSITVRFLADLTVTPAGPDLEVTYEEDCLPTVVATPELVKIGLFPNPSTGDFTIHNDGEENIVRMELRDIGGRLIYQIPTVVPVGGGAFISIEDDLARGTYLLRIISAVAHKDQLFVVQ